MFGYFIEITRANLQGFEPSKFGYHRKQTLSNAERFITDELKEKEDIILGAEDKAVDLEYQLFVRLREHIKTYTERLQNRLKSFLTLTAYKVLLKLHKNTTMLNLNLVIIKR